MALSAQDRARLWADVMREPEVPGSLTKANLKAALDAIDDWFDLAAVRTSLNNALPEPAKSTLTANQKAMLTCYVLARRVGRFRVEEDG